MPADPPAAETVGPPRPAVRAVVSLLVALHVAAVFIGPWAMEPSSGLARGFAGVFRPYMDVLSLGNGYRFFAPEPGPSHLVRYELTLDDGTLVEGAFPDRTRHWPRLLYHRYFMLSEFVNTLAGPELDNPRAKVYAQGYARHLADQYNAKTVKLYLRRHYVPRPGEVQRGLKLTDKSLYEERPLATFQRD